MKSYLVGKIAVVLNPLWAILVYLVLTITTLHLEVEILKTVHLELLVFGLCWGLVLLDLRLNPRRFIENRVGIFVANLLALLLIALPLISSLFSSDRLAILYDGEFRSYVKILLLSPLVFFYLSRTPHLDTVVDILCMAFGVLGIYFLYRYYFLNEARVFDGRPLLKIRHGDPNFLATFFAMSLPLSLMQAYVALSRRSHVRLLFYMLMSLFFFSLIIVTQSRMGFIVTVVGLLFIFTRRFKSSNRAYLIRLGVILLFLMGGLGALTVGEGITRFSNIQDKSSLDRILTYKNGLKVFIENPIIGVGMHNAKNTFFYNSQYPSFQSEFRPLEIHNTFLNVLAELGIIGFFGFAGLYFWSAKLILAAKSHRRTFLLASFIILALSGLTIGISYKDLALVQLFVLAGLAVERGVVYESL